MNYASTSVAWLKLKNKLVVVASGCNNFATAGVMVLLQLMAFFDVEY